MKKISRKIRNGVIDRYIMSTNELPHEISYKGKEDGWMVFYCKSANFSHEIAHKEQGNQFIKLS